MALRLAILMTLASICLAGCGEESPSSAASSTTGKPMATSSTECAEAADTSRVPVLVAADHIPAGTAAEDAIAGGLIVEREIDSDYRPAAAVVLLADMAGGVAIADLEANQVVVVNQWGLPEDVAVGDQQPTCDRDR